MPVTHWERADPYTASFSNFGIRVERNRLKVTSRGVTDDEQHVNTDTRDDRGETNSVDFPPILNLTVECHDKIGVLG